MTMCVTHRNTSLEIMSGSIPKAIIPPPPGQTPGHLTFLKMIDQIPHYMGRFQGQMPYWLGLKSQNFHNLSGIDEYGARIKKPGQKLHIYASHGSKIVMYLYWRFCSFKGFDKTLSAWLTLFCAERFLSVVCLLPLILRRDNFKLALSIILKDFI